MDTYTLTYSTAALLKAYTTIFYYLDNDPCPEKWVDSLSDAVNMMASLLLLLENGKKYDERYMMFSDDKGILCEEPYILAVESGIIPKEIGDAIGEIPTILDLLLYDIIAPWDDDYIKMFEIFDHFSIWFWQTSNIRKYISKIEAESIRNVWTLVYSRVKGEKNPIEDIVKLSIL